MKPIYSLCLAGLIIVMLASCGQKKEPEEGTATTSQTRSAGNNKKSYQPLADFDSLKTKDQTMTLLDSLCKHSGMNPDQGKDLKIADAARKIRSYKDFRTDAAREAGYEYDPKDDVYGFAFGINKINDLVKKINDYNTHHAGDSAIAGIRVYMGRSALGGESIPDAFLMPVLKTGHNLYDVDDDFEKWNSFTKEVRTDAPPMVNTSAPCPNRCP